MAVAIPRAAWAPKHGRGHATQRAQTRVVIHHDPMRKVPPNPTREQVAEQIRILEDWSAKAHTPTNPRISYHFVVVDQTAEVWEGLGWGRVGAHVQGHNTASLGIIIIGIDGQQSAGRPETWAAIAELIREGVRLGHLAPAEQLVVEPHRARVNTTCPGDRLARHVEGLRVADLLAARPLDPEPAPPPPAIPAPSGQLATEAPYVPELDLDRIIIPRAEHVEGLVRRERFSAAQVRPGLRVALLVARAMQLAGVRGAKTIADGLDEWLAHTNSNPHGG